MPFAKLVQFIMNYFGKQLNYFNLSGIIQVKSLNNIRVKHFLTEFVLI